MTLGQKIKQARESKNLSQEELAEKLGVSRQAVSKWENDNSIPQGVNRELMSQILGLNVFASEKEQIARRKEKRISRLGWGTAAVFALLFFTVTGMWMLEKNAIPIETEPETTISNESETELQAEFLDAFPMELMFSSGAGGWSTIITLRADGCFSGQYMDVEMGERDEEAFPDGTVYVSEFSGQFDEITQIGDYTYYMTLRELQVSTIDGEEWIVDGTRYIGTEPYGFEEGHEFIFHTPQMPVEGLPERFLSWWPAWQYSESELEKPETLSCYGLYNMAMGYGFFSYAEEMDSVPAFNENAVKPAAIETLTFGSTYDKMTFLGEPSTVRPIDNEAVISNQGHYVMTEYDGLTVTLSATDDFTLNSFSNIVAITAVSDVYTDSRGLIVGMSKDELRENYSLDEGDFLSGEENEEQYRIQSNLAAHDIPEFDTFYPADNGDSPVILIYLIKDDFINGILLRHLTAD